jgi:hypothetical protein
VLLVVVAALGVFAADALAQGSGGAFSKLSPGQQKIARALFDAQTQGPNAPRPLTLDEIAMKRQAHQGWGEVFKDMKAAGLLTDKSLGQVVRRADSPRADKMDKVDKPDKGDKPDKIEKVEKVEKVETVETMEKVDKIDRPERPTRH